MARNQSGAPQLRVSWSRNKSFRFPSSCICPWPLAGKSAHSRIQCHSGKHAHAGFKIVSSPLEKIKVKAGWHVLNTLFDDVLTHWHMARNRIEQPISLTSLLSHLVPRELKSCCLEAKIMANIHQPVQHGESPQPICHAEPFTDVILSEAKNLLRRSG
jgi:hypothetical protein